MRASFLLLAVVIVLSATAPTDAQDRDDRGYYGPDSPSYCRGPGTKNCNPYPSSCDRSRGHCWPRKGHGQCDGYRGSNCDAWWPPFTTYPLPYADGLYDTTAFTSWFAGWGALPYYDTDPTEYAYTPIDIPPREPVVRPDRPTTYSRIQPRLRRKPLYELLAAQQPPANTTSATVPSKRHLSQSLND